MKKLLTTICFILVFSMVFSSVCYAAGDNYDTLADWNIKIAVPDDTTAVLKGNEYYIYAQSVGSIPYVMLTTYKYDSEEKFIPDFTAYMLKQHSDLKVTAEAERKTIGNKKCYEIDYSYKVSGYDVKDRRIVFTVDGLTYLFTSKEVESLGMTIGSMLEDVVAQAQILSDNGDPFPDTDNDAVLANTYLYRQKDGMPKYWLDFTGVITDNLVLHCYFRSGEPTFYETFFILDLDTADYKDDRIEIHDVYNARGIDVSFWFKSLTLRLKGERAVLEVKRDESTLAGGAEDNILTGTYPMEPMSAGVDYRYYKDDGQLKYWLDLSGADMKLHAMFRSGDPEYYERVFTFDSKTARAQGDYTVEIRKVLTETGEDVSRWFKSLTLTQVQGSILMNVSRDESTLAGGADDNILTGVYTLEPHTYLLPEEEGPFTAEELAEWAQIYYFTRNGFFPPEAEVEKNKDGTFTIHLFEVVDLDGITHTATSAWYTVDKYGVGKDDITEQAVCFFR